MVWVAVLLGSVCCMHLHLVLVLGHGLQLVAQQQLGLQVICIRGHSLPGRQLLGVWLVQPVHSKQSANDDVSLQMV
jgi:hypothetical protein